MKIPSRNKSNLLAAVALAGAVAAPLAHAATHPFSNTELASGFNLNQEGNQGGGDGKSGVEGKCGDPKVCPEGKCGEGKCGEQCKDGHGDHGKGHDEGDKGKEDGKDKGKAEGEGKCGEGKCGAM